MTKTKLLNIARLLLAVFFLASLYTAIGFGMPLLQSLIPGATDGIAVPSTLLQLIFGDNGWTLAGYYAVVSRSLYTAFISLAAFAALTLPDLFTKRSNNHE